MSRRFKVSLAAVSLLALGACAQSPEQLAVARKDYLQIKPVEVTAELKLDTSAEAVPLGAMERQAVRMFAAAYNDEGHGPVIISRPEGNGAGAARSATEARAVLLSEGLEPGNIVEGPYDASGARLAPLVLSYRTWEAVVPDCPDLSQVQMGNADTNGAPRNFGCAVATNLAAMLADPSDLIGEQPMDPSDATRRTVVFSKYRAGTPTGAQQSNDASGAISGAIN